MHASAIWNDRMGLKRWCEAVIEQAVATQADMLAAIRSGKNTIGDVAIPLANLFMRIEGQSTPTSYLDTTRTLSRAAVVTLLGWLADR